MSRLSGLMRFGLTGCFFGIAFALFSPNAFAQQQDIQPLIDRLDRLERDIRTLNVQLSRGGNLASQAASEQAGSASVIGSPATARLGARMDDLESDLRTATGTIEFVNHQIIQINERLEKLVSDIDFRLSALEARGGQQGSVNGQMNSPSIAAAPSPAGVQSAGVQSLGTVSVTEVQKIDQKKGTATTAPPATTPPAAKAILPAGTVKDQYAYAFNLLRQTKYEEAEIAFKEFLKVHADDPLASNARYWLGETYYVRRAFSDAAQIFFEGFSKDSKGPKAADSLLKLGMSLASLDKKEEACSAFSKVLADFPKAPAGIKSAVLQERKRSSCP